MKKIISLFLSVLFILSLCSVLAFAQDETPLDVEISGVIFLTNRILPNTNNAYIRSLHLNAENGKEIYFLASGCSKLNKCSTLTFSGTGEIYIDFIRNIPVEELNIPANVIVCGESGGPFDEIGFDEDAFLVPGWDKPRYEPSESDKEYWKKHLHGGQSFGRNPALKKATLNNDYSHLSCAFEDCVNLEEVVLGATANKIAEAMFINCPSLKQFDLPSSIQKIEVAAFLNTGLKRIYVPATVTEIQQLALGYKGTEEFNLIRDFDTFYTTPRHVEKVDGFTIYGHKDTAAETYAIENGFTFVDVDERMEEPKVYATENLETASVGGYAEFDVTVGGSPDKIQFVNSKGGTTTYTRSHANVTEITEIPNGSEVWHVKLKVARASETYTIRLRYGRTWTDNDTSILLTAQKPETGVVSAEVAASAVVGDPGVISVTVKNSPSKVQFTNSRGGTFTYTRDHASVSEIRSNGDGSETWTITLKVYRKTETYAARAKYALTGWASDSAEFTLTAE